MLKNISTINLYENRLAFVEMDLTSIREAAIKVIQIVTYDILTVPQLASGPKSWRTAEGRCAAVPAVTNDKTGLADHGEVTERLRSHRTLGCGCQISEPWLGSPESMGKKRRGNALRGH